MIKYKSKKEVLSYKKTSFVSLLSSTFQDGYEEYEKDSSNLLNKKEFESILNQGFSYLMQENIDEVINTLFTLYKHFTTPNIDLTDDSHTIQLSIFCLYIFEYIIKPNFLPATPIFLQLFIEIIYKDKSNSIIEYCINHGSIEIIMYLKNSLPKIYYPLIMIFSYNLYSFCADFILTETNEYTRILNEVFDQIDNINFAFLSLLATINILRSTIIKNHDNNTRFFQIIEQCVKDSSPVVSINSMWCMYFWFKNSWENAAPYIDENLMAMLSDNIKASEFGEIIATSLYIYSFCWAVSDDLKKSYVEKYFPIDEIFLMTHSDDDDISLLALNNLNNFICDKYPNVTEFLLKGGFDYALEVMESGSTRCKIEAGFLIITAFEFITDDMMESYVNDNMISSLCEICMIESSDISELTIRILQFFCKILTNFSWIISVFDEIDFINEMQSFENSDLFDIISELDNEVQQIIHQQV